MKIRLGFSTCPNDTFMFDAIVHNRIDLDDFTYEIVLADIFHLNQMALNGELDMVKISYNTYGRIRDSYQLLDAGSALGHNCGPLLISKEELSIDQLIALNHPVAIPGENTTANLLLGYYAPQLHNKKEYIFHDIMPAIQNGEVAAGVIIHENRFTYQKMGLKLIQDLGAFWESQTQLPIPLGAIVAKKSLGTEVLKKVEKHMRESVKHAFTYPEVSQDYVRAHAQEMEDEVMQAHIKLYVNEFSVSLGETGRKAVSKVLEVGEAMGLYSSQIENE